MKAIQTYIHVNSLFHFAHVTLRSEMASASKSITKELLAICIFGLLSAGAGVARADTMLLFGTGLSTSGAPLPGGSADPHYTVLQTASPAIVLSSLWGNWGPDDATSGWIGWVDNAFPGAYGTYTFRLMFDITDHDPSAVSLSGAWAVDNSGHIDLNGQATGVSQGDDFGVAPTLNPFALTSGFVSGINTLDFVSDFPDGYDGLRVGNLVVNFGAPEPGSTWLLGLAICALLAFRHYLPTGKSLNLQQS